MELRHLRYFVAVAEESHFGRAAEQLLIATPTLSQQIIALEREIGARLFIRHSRGATMTAAGEALLPEARRTLEVADGALWTARRAGGVGDAPLRLGVLNGVPDWLPARLEQTLAAAAPGDDPVLVAGGTSEQIARLERGDLDLAMVRCPIDVPDGVELLEVFEEELGVLMSPTNALSAKPAVRCADLTGHELILFPRERAPGTYDHVLARLREGGATVNVSRSTMAMSQHRSTLRLRPGAISLASRRAAAPPDVVWRPLEGRPLTATIAVAWHAATRNARLRALLAGMRRELEDGPLT